MSFMFNQNKLSIPEFYNGKTIFITGGSGFIGKVLIAKLLRSCPDIRNIYVLMRPKKNKNVEERIKAMFNIPLFDKLKDENSRAIDKVLGVEGDIGELNLGLSETDVNTLTNTVSIIYHVAASVRFHDFLKTAILVNTRSTREIINLAKQMKSLNAFIYVSTAYCHADEEVIEEKMYPPKQDWREAISLAENYDEQILNVMTQKYIHPMPNTYTFTKALAERVVFDLCDNQLPATIIRPTIVSPSYCDPVLGWVDNFNGPIALEVLGYKGILKVLMCDPNVVHDHVVVDNVAKCLTAAVWKKTFETHPCSVTIYNVANDFRMPLSHLLEMGKILVPKNPSDSYLMTVRDIILVNNATVLYCLTIFLHLIPGLMIDGVLLISGKKTRMLKTYRKIYIANICLIRFLRTTFQIESENYMALESFFMDSDRLKFETSVVQQIPIDSVAFHQKAAEAWCSVKKYLMNEKPHATEAEIIRYARFQTVQGILAFIVKGLIYFLMFSKLFLPWVIAVINEIMDDDS